MKLNILSDANWESGLDKTLKEISLTGYRALFEARDYGKGLLGIVVILMCRDPNLNFKRRVRFVKKERMLYLDVMLDLNVMRECEDASRRNIVVQKIKDNITQELHKYAFPEFDESRFLLDLNSWLGSIQ